MPSGAAAWRGIAGYASYQWTNAIRTALRLDYFKDADGVRNGIRSPGEALNLWETTLTFEYKIWRGFMTRLEYRHDQADHQVFHVRNPGPAPTSRSQDTMNLAHCADRVRRVMEYAVGIGDVKALVIERQTFAISDRELAALAIQRKMMS